VEFDVVGGEVFAEETGLLLAELGQSVVVLARAGLTVTD
jgi:hypothetical protein